MSTLPSSSLEVASESYRFQKSVFVAALASGILLLFAEYHTLFWPGHDNGMSECRCGHRFTPRKVSSVVRGEICTYWNDYPCRPVILDRDVSGLFCRVCLSVTD